MGRCSSPVACWGLLHALCWAAWVPWEPCVTNWLTDLGEPANMNACKLCMWDAVKFEGFSFRIITPEMCDRPGQLVDLQVKTDTWHDIWYIFNHCYNCFHDFVEAVKKQLNYMYTKWTRNAQHILNLYDSLKCCVNVSLLSWVNGQILKNPSAPLEDCITHSA